MTSSFTWLDYSEYERRKMLDVIDLFGEKTTRDELGIGGVRDAFADLLFPGTSTIQTAAKYFLFVPWIYQTREKRRTPSATIADLARKAEIKLAEELEESGETEGVIGRFAKERLQRLPSSVYWQGLARWGIRKFSGSRDEYHRSLDQHYLRQRVRHVSRAEHDGESQDECERPNWHVSLPAPPPNFPHGVELKLKFEEADYLRERVLTSCGGSLLAWLVRERINMEDVEFPWFLQAELPEPFRTQVRHGRNFSEVMHGAQLLYNLMLAEKCGWREKIDLYQGVMAEWWQQLSARRSEVQQWNLTDFWKIVHKENPRVHTKAQQFIDGWIKRVLQTADLDQLIASKESRQHIEDREVWLKRGLARLRNDLARKSWNGAAGATQLDLRWNSARRILGDILAGLEVESNA